MAGPAPTETLTGIVRVLGSRSCRGRPARIGPCVDRAAVDDAAPVVQDRLACARGRRRSYARVRLARVLEAGDALVHVPAERADDADVVVVPHVAVGDDVEARFFLVADHRRHGVGVRLFVLDFLERDANVAAQQLLLEPVRPRIRPDHGGREKRVDDLRCHVVLCC